MTCEDGLGPQQTPHTDSYRAVRQFERFFNIRPGIDDVGDEHLDPSELERRRAKSAPSFNGKNLIPIATIIFHPDGKTETIDRRTHPKKIVRE